MQRETMNTLPLRLGLTMWSHNQWQQDFYGSGTKPAERLEKYAQVFHTVEGNTTFYATPNTPTVLNWRAATHDDFRFTFKLPKLITHQQMLKGSQGLLREFLSVMEPLHPRIGNGQSNFPRLFHQSIYRSYNVSALTFPKGFRWESKYVIWLFLRKERKRNASTNG